MTTHLSTADLPEGSPLDEGLLNRMAGAFFAALPGQAPSPGAMDTMTPGAGTTALAPGRTSSDLPTGGGAPRSIPAPPHVEARRRDIPEVWSDQVTRSPAAASPPVLPAQGPGQVPQLPYLSDAVARAGSTPAAPSSFYFLEQAGVPGNQDFYFLTAPSRPPVSAPFDVEGVRGDFPILRERVNGRPLVWLDNAATTQKPQAVIDRLVHFYAHENSNVHRAAHPMAARATDAYEGARAKLARFLGAPSKDDIVFVRGATEGINLVAQTWGRQNVGAGDEILVSHLEHHANIVPWQLLAQEKGAQLKVIPVDDNGQILLDELGRLLSERTRLVSVTHVSNALGTVVPIAQVVAMAHAAGAKVLIDGAQSVAHLRVDMQSLDPDFFVLSGHKMYGPTGIGVLYGRQELLQHMPVWQGGGNMISEVSFERTLYQEPPARFEAGTGNIADAVGLGAAVDYLERIGLQRIAQYEHDLLGYALKALQEVPGIRMFGTAPEKTSVLSFVLDGHRTDQVGSALGDEGIAVRASHHCAQPILRRFGVPATVRASLAMYNTCADVDALVAALKRL